MSKLKPELLKFIIVGVSAVLTDLFSYYLLLNFLPHHFSKAISFVLGAFISFIVNKYWTFKKHDKSYKEPLQFALLYTITLGTNVIINQIVLDSTNIVILAFLIATTVSTVLNFSGQKWWVFK